MRTYHPDPYRLTHADCRADPGEAVRDLARELFRSHVHQHSVYAFCRDAAARQPKPLEVWAVNGYVRDIWLARKTWKAPAATSINEDADKANVPPPVDLPVQALGAWIRAHCHAPVYDSNTGELEVIWTPSIRHPADDAPPGTVAVHETIKFALTGTDKEIQFALARRTGSLATWAGRAHPRAKPRDVLRCLWDLVGSATLRSAASTDSESVALVDAILAMRVWSIGTTTGYTRLSADPGVHRAEGVALLDEGKRLVVDPASLGTALRDTAFARRKASVLRQLLREAPGACNDQRGYHVPRETRDILGRGTVGIDLSAFYLARQDAAADEAPPAKPHPETPPASEPAEPVDMFEDDPGWDRESAANHR